MNFEGVSGAKESERTAQDLKYLKNISKQLKYFGKLTSNQKKKGGWKIWIFTKIDPTDWEDADEVII